VINGVSIFLGVLSGGFFVEHVSLTWMNTFLVVFVMSGIMRAIISIIMIPMLKEVRDIPKNKPRMSFMQYIYLITPRPLFGMYRGVKSITIGMGELSLKKTDK
jgi:energy-converting hydrogenase Eha subunit A